MAALPRVDLSDADHLQKLARAISPEGPGRWFPKMARARFFYLKFPDDQMERLAEDTLQMSREFFALPLAEKELLKNDLDACYWIQTELGVTQIPSTGAGYRAVSEDSNFAGDMRESFNLRMESASSSGANLCTDLCGLGDNKWPQAGMASEEWCQRFRAKSNEYFDLCFRTCSQLRKLLAHGDCLGQFLGTDSASDEAFSRSTSLLGFTHYNYDFKPGESYGSEQIFGIRPHQDDGMCTLLYTDGSPGLEYARGRSEVETDLGRDDAQFSSDIIWEAVPFLPGHWIVNLGTDLFRWTQQRSAVDGAGCKACKATLHRVVPAPGAMERYSMPFFYEANLDTPDPCFPYKKRYEYLIEEAGDKIKTRQQIPES